MRSARAIARSSPPVCVSSSGGTSPEAIDVAGRHAEVYATWGETLDATREVVARVRASAARYGRRPGFSLSLRPVIAGTEEAAWKKAADIVEQVRATREAAGLPVTGHAPANDGSRRLLQSATARRQDKRLWTGVAQLTGAAGNSTGLVGTPEQVADAMLDHCEIGIDHFLIRGFDSLADAIGYGSDSIPLVRANVAEFAAARFAPPAKRGILLDAVWQAGLPRRQRSRRRAMGYSDRYSLVGKAVGRIGGFKSGPCKPASQP